MSQVVNSILKVSLYTGSVCIFILGSACQSQDVSENDWMRNTKQDSFYGLISMNPLMRLPEGIEMPAGLIESYDQFCIAGSEDWAGEKLIGGPWATIFAADIFSQEGLESFLVKCSQLETRKYLIWGVLFLSFMNEGSSKAVLLRRLEFVGWLGVRFLDSHEQSFWLFIAEQPEEFAQAWGSFTITSACEFD